jgi:hypothetical protein
MPYFIFQKHESAKVADIELIKRVDSVEGEIAEIKRDYATKEELAEEVKQILGTADLDDLKKNLDTILEIQGWIEEHGNEFNQLIQKLESVKRDVLEHVAENYVNKDDFSNAIAKVDGLNRQFSKILGEFGDKRNTITDGDKTYYLQRVEVPGGYYINEVRLIIKVPSTAPLDDAMLMVNRVDMPIDEESIGRDFTLAWPGEIGFEDPIENNEPNIYSFSVYDFDPLTTRYVEFKTSSFNDFQGRLVVSVSR